MATLKSIKSHNAVPFIAAMMLYNSFNESHKTDQPWIRRNMALLIPEIQKKFQLTSITIKFNLSMITPSNYHWNIYKNVCSHRSLQIELNNIMNLHKIPCNTVFLSSNLVTRIMETNRTKCVKCNSKLKRNFKHKKNTKGTIGLYYDNKIGIIITINYVHKCTKENCNCVYYHNHYFINGSFHLENVENCSQMNSKATFINDNVIDEAINFAVKATSFASYTEEWNERFSDEINEIKSYLISTKQTLGYRGTDPSLCVNRLADAILFRGLHTTLELELNQNNIFVEKEVIDKYRQQKMQKLLGSEIEEDRQLNCNWLNSRDYFKIIFDKYEHMLPRAGMQWLKWVPVKDGKIMMKHFILQGDVAVGINIASCSYPPEFYQKEIEHLKSQMDEKVFLRMRCHDSPQRGNGSSYTFATCERHTIKLNQNGIATKKINKFCQYERYQREIKSYLNNHQEEKDNQSHREQKLQEKINSFLEEDVTLFKEVRNKILNITSRPRRSNYQQTMANLNESVQYELDEEILTTLEEACKENNIDTNILNHPELLKILEDEVNDPEAWDNLEGCRKGHHVFKKNHDINHAVLERSGGIQAWWTQSGYCFSLEEVEYRETATQVIMSLTSILLLCNLTTEWTERMCGIGYDMMCKLFARMITLIMALLLPVTHISLLIHILPYLHIDRWHVLGHVAVLCQVIGGLFHPFCEKFKGILYGHGQKNNDQVAEQNWVGTNKLTFIKNMNKREFKTFLVLYKVKINKRTTRRLLKQKYTFIPISKVKKIRNLTEIKTILPTTEELLTLSCYQNLSKPEIL
eukprot:291067_1